MNLQETHVMRRMEQVVMAGNNAVVETQFGDVRVHPTRFHGYAAELVDANNQKFVEFGTTPKDAFWKLGGTLKAMNN